MPPLPGFQPNRCYSQPFLATNPNGIGQECPRASSTRERDGRVLSQVERIDAQRQITRVVKLASGHYADCGYLSRVVESVINSVERSQRVGLAGANGPELFKFMHLPELEHAKNSMFIGNERVDLAGLIRDILLHIRVQV